MLTTNYDAAEDGVAAWMIAIVSQSQVTEGDVSLDRSGGVNLRDITTVFRFSGVPICFLLPHTVYRKPTPDERVA